MRPRSLLLKAARANADGLVPLLLSLHGAAESSGNGIVLPVALFEDAVAAFVGAGKQLKVARLADPGTDVVHFKQWERFVDGDGVVALAPFVAWLRGNVSARRSAAIARAWVFICPRGIGATLQRSELFAMFVSWDRWLPFATFQRGWMREGFAFDRPDYLETAPATQAGAERAVSFEEFTAYFTDVGAPIADDSEFDDLLRKCWTLPQAPAAASRESSAAQSSAATAAAKKFDPNRIASLGATLVPTAASEAGRKPVKPRRERGAEEVDLPFPVNFEAIAPRGRKKVATPSVDTAHAAGAPFATTHASATAACRGVLPSARQPPTLDTPRSPATVSARTPFGPQTPCSSLASLGGAIIASARSPAPATLFSPAASGTLTANRRVATPLRATITSITGYDAAVVGDPLEAELQRKRAEQRALLASRVESLCESLDASLRPLATSGVAKLKSKGLGAASPHNPRRAPVVEAPPRRPLAMGTYHPAKGERADDGRSVAGALAAGCKGPLGEPSLYDTYSVALDDATNPGGGKRLVPAVPKNRPLGFRPRRKRMAPAGAATAGASADFKLALGAGTPTARRDAAGRFVVDEGVGRTEHWYSAAARFNTVVGIERATPGDIFERRDWGANVLSTNGVERSSSRWRPAAECDQLRARESHDPSCFNPQPAAAAAPVPTESDAEFIARKEAEEAASFQAAVLAWRAERPEAKIVSAGGGFVGSAAP